MASYGWIALDRAIVENWIYKDKPFDRLHAWIDLLLLAEHSTKKKMWRGSITDFNRGDVCLSIEKLSERWGWSRKKTRHFLEQLEKDQMVHLRVTPHRTVISIVNYAKFQDVRTPKGTPKRTPNGNQNGTPKGTTEGKHLNNDNNDKQINNKQLTLDDDDDYVSDEEWARRLAEQDDDW